MLDLHEDVWVRMLEVDEDEDGDGQGTAEGAVED